MKAQQVSQQQLVSYLVALNVFKAYEKCLNGEPEAYLRGWCDRTIGWSDGPQRACKLAGPYARHTQSMTSSEEEQESKNKAQSLFLCHVCDQSPFLHSPLGGKRSKEHVPCCPASKSPEA